MTFLWTLFCTYYTRVRKLYDVLKCTKGQKYKRTRNVPDGTCTKAMEAHVFYTGINFDSQIFSSFPLKFCAAELKICQLNIIPVRKSEPLWLP